MRPKKTILCVDDNEQSLSIRKFLLETRGYRVFVCTSGQAAIEFFRDQPIDLLLSDLLMPDMDGAELVRRIKQLSPDTPAILYSGRVVGYDDAMHADLFLPKGTHAPAELLERIRVILVRKRGPKKGSHVSRELIAVS